MKLSKLTNDQQNKVLKTALYIGLSAALAQLISVTTSTPDLFGVYTPVINWLLVTAKQFVTEE